MTAPGQEPDEIITATPGGEDKASDSPDLDAIGDNHMPADLRHAEQEGTPRGADTGANDDAGMPDLSEPGR
jgi:hypothetical protein